MARPIRLLCSTVVAVLVAGAVLVGVDEQAQAAFPGKNGRIAFTRFPEIGDAEIYKMFPDGSAQKQVTYNSTNDVRPAWSPDGTKIAYERSNRIFVKDTRNGEALRLSADYGNGPAWSPDGTRIAFASERDGDQEIYTMNSSDGSGGRKLTNNHNHDVHPSWSPDGTKIAFERDYDIWVMKADGTDQNNLTNSPNMSEYEPDWSPDGTRIVFQKWGGDLGFQTDIISMTADGSGLVNLTKTPDVSEDFPAWSPDGRKIAYSVSFGDLWMMNAADGSRQVNLTKTPEIGEFLPDWQPAPVPRG
jgi:tol-pal system beta propeller repeat protein TolB